MPFDLSEFKRPRQDARMTRLLLAPLANLLEPFIPSPRPFAVSCHELKVRGLKSPLTLVQLSDLHLSPLLKPESVAAWVDASNAQAPDLILISGDILDYRARGLEDASLAELGRLSAPLGVWASWGNQDYLRSEAERRALHDKLTDLGVRVLVNEAVPLRDDLTLAGLDDLLQGDPELSFLKEPRDSATLLLGHSPDVLPLLPETLDLALFGHTHGGQIRLPLVGALKTSSKYGQRYLEGWQDGPPRAYVSRGLGTTGLPLRIGSGAELVVMRLIPVTQVRKRLIALHRVEISDEEAAEALRPFTDEELDF